MGYAIVPAVEVVEGEYLEPEPETAAFKFETFALKYNVVNPEHPELIYRPFPGYWVCTRCGKEYYSRSATGRCK